MGTSRVDDTLPVTSRAATGGRHAARGRGRRGTAGPALLLGAALPALLGLGGLLLDREGPYLPVGDQAILELTVRDVGRHEVLLGPYSRFGWYHPGPLAAYLLAVPYRLLGGAHQSLAVGALVIGGIGTVAAVLLVRRRAGTLAAVWALLVVTVTVRLLGADFLRDSWNPHLPVLPFLAGVLLCWTAIRGDAWALPVAVVPMSLAVQSHVGYLPPVGAVGVVLVAGLLLRAVRHRRPDGGRTARGRGRWLVAAVAAVVVGALLWLPPIVQQVTGTPGNAGVVFDDLRRGSADASVPLPDALRAIADELGRLPVYVVGADPPDASLVPGRWPPWAIAAGAALFVAALAVGLLRRRGDVVWLGVLTLAVAAAGVAAVARIEGLPLYYITRWTVVVGVLAWTTVGVGLLPELATGVHRTVGRSRQTRRAVRPEAVLGVPLAALAAVAVLVTGVGTALAETPSTDVTGQVGRLGAAVVADLDRQGLRTAADPPVVRVDFADTTRPVLVGTIYPGFGLVLYLVRAGVDVQVLDVWRLPFGPRYTDRSANAGYVVTVAYADGSSPPPEPWQRVLAVEGGFAVHGGMPPAG